MRDGVERCTICQAMLDDEDLFCPNCGTEAPAHEKQRHEPGTLIATHNFQCHGCGAAMSYDASAQSLRCPFCGSLKLEARDDERTWVPDLIVPFVLEREEAIARMRQWLQHGFWRPGDLARAANITKIAAVYVPYWVFSARTFSYWTADSSQTPPGARSDWYPVAGEHRDQHRGLLVGASGALTPAETSALVPFDLQAAVPRTQIDLENVIFEQFRVQRKYARPHARAGFEKLVRQACQKYVPGSCRNLKVNVRIEELTSEALFLPVWIVAYRYGDHVFRFLLNGQTGKATGEAPTSWHKAAIILAAVALCFLLGFVAAALCSGLVRR